MNVHEYMKLPDRAILGKVETTYVTPLKSGALVVQVPSEPYNSRKDQTTDKIDLVPFLHFTTYDNDLSGRYLVSDLSTQVGWWSTQLSNGIGELYPAVTVLYTFSSRPLRDLYIAGDSVRNNFPVNFSLEIISESQGTLHYDIVGNTQVLYTIIDLDIPDAISASITITKISQPHMPVCLVEVSVGATFIYEAADLMSIDLLEELTYEDNTEVLGGVSANELRVTFNNASREFFFNNPESKIAKQLKKNRKLVGWLGFIDPDTAKEIWIRLGTFWSYSWNVPAYSLHADCVAFDTIGLLGTTEFIDHQVLVNFSIGELIEYIIRDAQKYVSELFYSIDASLYSIIVPYAWFSKGTHMSALKQVASSYPIDIFCNRDGSIIARNRQDQVANSDQWSENTNVISVEYPTLYTSPTNTVQVTVYDITVSNETILNISESFYLSLGDVLDFNFSKPAYSNINISSDGTAEFDTDVYSWGMRLSVTKAGMVYFLQVTANALIVDNTSVITQTNTDGVTENGPITVTVEGRFIQSISLASEIASRILANAAIDKFDAEVTYRGNAALTIGNTVELLEGLAPTSNYLIRKHQLFWNGGLSGQASISTVMTEEE